MGYTVNVYHDSLLEMSKLKIGPLGCLVCITIICIDDDPAVETSPDVVIDVWHELFLCYDMAIEDVSFHWLSVSQPLKKSFIQALNNNGKKTRLDGNSSFLE